MRVSPPPVTPARDGSAARRDRSAGSQAPGRPGRALMKPGGRVDPLPQHVAIIMDGNGRWATARGGARAEGHRQGAEAVRRTVRAARELGIRTLTLYAFSAQNWQRPAAEVADLMRLLLRFVHEERAELAARGI